MNFANLELLSQLKSQLEKESAWKRVSLQESQLARESEEKSQKDNGFDR